MAMACEGCPLLHFPLSAILFEMGLAFYVRMKTAFGRYQHGIIDSHTHQNHIENGNSTLHKHSIYYAYHNSHYVNSSHARVMCGVL